MRATVTKLFSTIVFVALLAPLVFAQNPVPDSALANTPSNQLFLIPQAPELDVKAYVLMDSKTGHIIAAKHPNQHLEPASLTKLMTLYLVFSSINQGTIHLDDKVHISKKAWQMGGSKMFVKAGDDVPVSTLIQGVIVDSGNDATVALAEFVAGSESSFVDMMNMAAKRLGMNDTHFLDATGLPHANHYTSAHDLAIVASAIINNFPQDYHFFSEKWFTYGTIKQPNRNRLLWRYEGADGLKTGHTEKAGFCLVSSAQKNGTRLVSVVLGAPSDEARSADSIRLLTYGFRFFTTTKLYDANTAITTLPVRKGESDKVALGLASPLWVTIPVGAQSLLKTNKQLPKVLEAPVTKGQSYGSLMVSFKSETIADAPLIALTNNDTGGLWSKMKGETQLLMDRWFHDDDDSSDQATDETNNPATSTDVTTDSED